MILGTFLVFLLVSTSFIFLRVVVFPPIDFQDPRSYFTDSTPVLPKPIKILSIEERNTAIEERFNQP